MNMVIHANGGRIGALITPEAIEMRLTDSGPGIADIELAMREGFPPPATRCATWASVRVWAFPT
jgi:anti-sigma regulatory factor (Ser/Thr protein kinase)